MIDNLINFDKLISLSSLGYLVLGISAYLYYSIIIYPYYLSPLSKLPRGQNPILHYFTYVYALVVGDVSIHLKLSQKHGPIVHLADNMVLINDKEVRKHYMTYKCPKAKNYQAFDFNGPTLFSATKKDFHASMRKLLLPAFNNKSLAAMDDKIYRVGSESLVQYIDSFLEKESSHEFDILDLFYSNTFDVISELVFGTNLNATWDREKGIKFMKTFSTSQLMLFIRTFIPFLNLIKLPMETLLTPIIMENIDKRKGSNEEHHDILQSMIDAKDPETGLGLTNSKIIDQCITLLFAAQDTTANSLNWTLYELLKNPEYYKLVADEILEKFPNLNEPINSQDAKKELKYLEAAILESNRVHPAGADIMPREVPEGGLTIKGYHLPPKTIFAIDIFCEHNDPSFWENPRTYNINRWLEGDRESKKSKLVGFGLGPRSCIGRDLAWNEIFLVLANLIRHFNFELVDKELIPVNYFTLKPKSNSFKVKISRRP